MDFFKKNLVVQGSVDRPNVVIHVGLYKTSGAKGQEEIKWDDTANQIIQMVGDEPSIVYCSYA